MKLCCCWCLTIFETTSSSVQDPRYGRVFCSIGCRDADTLFKNYIEAIFPEAQEVKVKRLPKIVTKKKR
jgi:hypothetical protein